jgi:hypothetical protein
LLLIDDYDRLADLDSSDSETESAGNPLQKLRGWLQAAGLQVQRLHPLDTDTDHLLLAEGRLHESRIAA